MHIRDRIKELRRVRAAELIPNPKNWRTHPARQQDALRGILAEVGYADALLAREVPGRGLMLIDGHLRAETTPEAIVPVLVLDLDEAEADKLLAALDPLAGLAETDGAKLDDLLATVKTESAALGAMLAGLAAAAIATEPDGSAAEAPANDATSGAVAGLEAKYAIVVHCETEQEQLALLERFEQEGLKCRALVV